MIQDKKNTRPSSMSQQIETASFNVIDAGANISIEVLEQTQKVLDHAEVLARRLVEIKTRMDRFTQESRVVFKQQALDSCRDFAEVGTELAKSCGKVGQASLDELKNFGYNGKSIINDLLGSSIDLGKPFGKQSYSERNKATIIPISIQDN